MSRTPTADPDPPRYHPALVTLHWLIALLIVAPLAIGQLVLAKLPSTAPLLLHGLRAHMSVGFLIGIVMLARLFVRIGTRNPGPATTGSLWVGRLARASQGFLYVAVLGEAASGVLLAWTADLFRPVLAGQGALPADFPAFPAFTVHYVFSRLLLVLVALHVMGVLYHKIALRDGLLGRMTFGER